MKNWILRRIDRRGYIPQWVFWIWPDTHWCFAEPFDSKPVLVIWNREDCVCGKCRE